MGETNIAWTHTKRSDGTWAPGYSFNPWVGCTKVSPACDHCYAEGWAKRTGHPELWTGERRRTSQANWKSIRRLDAKAEATGLRLRVFCASLADVFDNQADPAWREDLWELIAACINLDWLLLTKRPQNIAKMLPHDWADGWPHVALGVTAENRAELARRGPPLLEIPAAAHFLSCEPLLEPMVLPPAWMSASYQSPHPGRIDWVIVGGESGSGARAMMRTWASVLIEQCRFYGVPVFMKQTGSNRMAAGWPDTVAGKGDDPDAWPEELRIQQLLPPLRAGRIPANA